MTVSSLPISSGSGLSGNSASASASQASAAAAAATATSPLAKAVQRIQSDVTATTTQLSKFGLLKSALSDGQLTAQALGKLTSSASASDVTKALGNFFNRLNASVGAANAAVAANPASAAASSAKRVLGDLKSALRSDPATVDALKKLGLSLQGDGSLLQDAKKFAAALTSDPVGTRAALATLGKKVDALSSRELASGGTLTLAVSGLSQHNTALAAQQKALTAYQSSLSSS
jgi:hypothetical protein